MAVLDISQKLNEEEEAKIKIDAEHEFNIDCGAETMLVAEQKFKEGQAINDFYEIIKLFAGEEATKIIRAKNYSVKKLSTIIIAIMAQVNELSFEEMEERFRKQSK